GSHADVTVDQLGSHFAPNGARGSDDEYSFHQISISVGRAGISSSKLVLMLATSQPFTPQELLIHTPDGKTRNLPLDRERFTLGRSSTNELCYAEDAGLSRQHLAIEKVGQSWTVRDLGSKNGTLVNGIRIASAHPLGPNDRITAGHLVIE